MAGKFKYFWKVQSGIAINHMKFDQFSNSSQTEHTIPLVYLIIPGNPGCIHFYEKFSEKLYSSTNVPVWGISHTGHAQALPEDEMSHPKATECGLEKQIQHKIDFLTEEVFPKVGKVILIGHSIGCYIILQIMERMKEHEQCFLKSVLLFPTIERMQHTPKGKVMTPLLSNARWLFMLSVGMLRFLPKSAIEWMMPWIVKSTEKCITQTILDHCYAPVTDCCTFMALQEMFEVSKRDDKIIEKHIGKLIFYYGASDEWCPVSYHDEVVSVHGHREGCDIHLCQKGVAHAFVLNHSIEMADLVAQWLTEMKL